MPIIPKLFGCQVIGDSIIFQIVSGQNDNGKAEHLYYLCQDRLYVDQVISKIKDSSSVVEKNIMLYLGTTDLSSKSYCSIKFKSKMKALVKLLKTKGAERIFICSILPKIGLENDHNYYRNLEYTNSSLFFSAGEVEDAYFIPLFDRFTVSVGPREKFNHHKYFDNVGKLKYQPKLVLYKAMSGKGDVLPLTLNERGVNNFSRILSSYLTNITKVKPVYQILHSTKDDVADNKGIPNKILLNVNNLFTSATCMNDILEEGEEKAFTGEEDLPCFVPIRVGDVEVDALVDEGCPHVLLDQDLYEGMVTLNPEIRKGEFPAQGVLRYQNAMGVKKVKPNKSVALRFSFGENIFKDELFYVPCVIVKNLNAKMLVGRQWRRLFQVATDDKTRTIRLINPSNDETVIYDYTSRSRAHTNETGVKWLNCNLHLSPDVDLVCQFAGCIDDVEKRKHDILIKDAKSKVIETLKNESHLTDKMRSSLNDILLKHCSVFRDEVGKCNVYRHHLRVQGLKDMRCKNRPINHSIESKVREVIREWRQQGIIVPSESPYRVQLQPVEKKNGKYRPCGDFRPLNEHLIMHTNEVPRIPDLRAHLKGRRYFSRIDFRESFLQILLDDESQQYCAFVFDGVPYQFTRVPFGTKDSMPAFIKALQIILEGTEDFAIAYVDDILIHSYTLDEHLRHIDEILSRIEAAGFTLNVEKCQWLKQQVEFVGMLISEQGVEPIPEKVAGIREFPRPTTKRHLQSFLGMINFYRHYIPRCADIEKPLYEISSPNAVFKWTEVHQQSFELLKKLLSEATIQQHPDFTKPFYIVTDASKIGVAGAIYQFDEKGQVRPICFNSRTLSSAERNYTTLEQELLAVIYTLKKNYYMLIGMEIYLYTDSSSLTLLRQRPYLSPRVLRWLIYLDNFDLKMGHIAGKDNIVADTLSRYHHQMMSQTTPGYLDVNYIAYKGIDNFQKSINRLGDEQLKDVLVKQFLLDSSKVPKMKRDEKSGHFLWQNQQRDSYAIYVPNTLRSEILRHYHEYYVHPGTWKMLKMIRRTYNWPGIVEDVSQHCRNCVECCVAKTRKKHLFGPMTPIQATKPGELVCVDFCGPLPQSRAGCKMITVVMDHFTKFTKLYPIKNATAEATIRCVERFIEEFGPIQTILSDNGPQFASNLWRSHWKAKGIEIRKTSFYTPQSNPVERVMSTIKEVFRIKCRAQQKKWIDFLADIEHKLNHVTHRSTEAVPFELATGKPGDSPNPNSIPTPAVASPETAKLVLQENAKKRTKRFNDTHQLTELKVGDEVLVVTHCQSDKDAGYNANLDLVYEGPYVVVKKYRDNVYCLRDEGDPDPTHILRKNIRELALIR